MGKVTEREFHPVADIFPLLEGGAFDEFVEDIRKNGFRTKILVDEDGKILDGRNRYRGGKIVGIDPPFETYIGDDPLSRVVSLNLERRHLTESQRAMAGARIANLKQHDNQNTVPSIEGTAISQPEAAAKMKVSRASVERATKVQKHGVPELVKAVDRGEVSVSAASDIARLPKPEQKAAVKMGAEQVRNAAKRAPKPVPLGTGGKTIRELTEELYKMTKRPQIEVPWLQLGLHVERLRDLVRAAYP